MPDQDFTLVVTGTIDDGTVERLFEAGLDDATVRSSGGIGFVDVTRDAPTMTEALASAIRQVRSAGLEGTRGGTGRPCDHVGHRRAPRAHP